MKFMPIAKASTQTTQLLADNRSFQDLLWPYLTPYLVYVAISSIPDSLLPAEITQAFKLAATAGVLIWFLKHYRFGPLKPVHGIIALLALPVALLCWIGPFYLLTASGLSDVASAGAGEAFSTPYFYLRVFNSAVLVAVFEELFMRVYVMGWLHQAELQRREKGMAASILDTLDQRSQPLNALPLSSFAVIGTTLVFAAGHQVHEYLSAILYFLFTTWLYKKSGSLWVCILIHGLTNLVIALLVRYTGMGWLW
jgi:membrane protease YdiL (CAAX protease family)